IQLSYTSSLHDALPILLNQQGLEAEAVALGQVNEETAYALNEFGQEAPRVIESIGTQTDTVALVDHNESQQSVADLAEVEVHSRSEEHTSELQSRFDLV